MVLAVVELVCPHFAEHGIVPQGFDTGTVQPTLHAPFALERLPTPFRGRAVVGLEDLVVGIFGHLAPLQRDDVPSFLLANLQRVLVAILPADQRLVMVGAVAFDQFLQPSDAAGQRMAELRAQLFAPLHHLLPVVARYAQTVSFGTETGDIADQRVQHRGVQRIGRDRRLRKRYQLTVLVVAVLHEEVFRPFILADTSAQYLSSHDLFGFAILGDKALLVFGGKGGVGIQGAASLATATAQALDVFPADIAEKRVGFDYRVIPGSQFLVGHA